MEGQVLRDAAYAGDLAMLRAELRRSGRRHVDSRDESGYNALHCAAFAGRLVCLEALLAAGASVHSVTEGGSTPLHSASVGGYVACVRALIAAGSDVNRANRSGYTPFALALYDGHRRVLKILLRAGADVDTRGALPTHPAVSNTDAWALVVAFRKVGDWSSYVRRRRAICASVIEKAITRDALPHDINLEIAAFVEPPGGY